MNIALAPTSYFPRSGGVSVAVRNLAGAFVQKGHTVVIITPRLDESQPSYEVLDGIGIHRMRFVLPWRLLWQNPEEGLFRFLLHGPGAVKRLVHLIRQKRIEVINVHHFGPQLPYLLFAQLFTNAQAVLTLHGTEFFRLHPSSDWMRRFLVEYSLRRAKWVIAASSHSSGEIARLCPEASRRTVRISNGVAVDEFSGADRPSFRPPYILS
ncbi:MAG: glycosyltransferase family 4 protein, partial [Candidatus Methylomirabilis sp.]